MSNGIDYLERKQSQVHVWICQLARLDALCRQAGKSVEGEFEDQISELGDNLEELHSMFQEFQELNDDGREKFIQVVERNWNEIEEGFNNSLSEYEYLIRARTEGY